MKQTQEKQIRIVGIDLVTSEQRAPQEIGALWQKAAMAGLLQQDAPNYGVYTDYKDGRRGEYRVIVGSESAAPAQEGQVVIEIPAGRYQVLKDEGSVPEIVSTAWAKVWETWEEERSYHVDYEQYLGTPEHSKFELHIGVK